MHEIGFVYRDILLEFLFEIYVFYLLTTRRLKRSDHFAAGAAGGALLVLASAVGGAAAYLVLGYTVWGRILIYLALFAVSLVHLRLCFAEAMPTILFVGSICYAAQNLCYKLRLLLVAPWIDRLASRLSEPVRWLCYRGIYLDFFALAAAAVYLLLLRRIIRLTAGSRLDSRMLAYCLVILAVTLILCSAEDVAFARMEAEHLADPGYQVLRLTGNLFSVLCCLVVLLLASRTVERRELMREVEYLQHAVRQSKRQYELARDTIDMINIKCHDIRYRLSSLAVRDGRVVPQAMEDLQKSISIYDAQIETGNQLLDVLLTEKSLYCEQNGITFSCMADGEKLNFLQDSDLYCLFGNIVDNALEAVRAVPDRQRRVINLLVRSQGSLLLIQEDNYFTGNLTFSKGLPVTTKADKSSHGFGLRSIRMIARKYGGELTTSARNGVFHLNILFGADSAD